MIATVLATYYFCLHRLYEALTYLFRGMYVQSLAWHDFMSLLDASTFIIEGSANK